MDFKKFIDPNSNWIFFTLFVVYMFLISYVDFVVAIIFFIGAYAWIVSKRKSIRQQQQTQAPPAENVEGEDAEGTPSDESSEASSGASIEELSEEPSKEDSEEDKS